MDACCQWFDVQEQTQLPTCLVRIIEEFYDLPPVLIVEFFTSPKDVQEFIETTLENEGEDYDFDGADDYCMARLCSAPTNNFFSPELVRQEFISE